MSTQLRSRRSATLPTDWLRKLAWALVSAFVFMPAALTSSVEARSLAPAEKAALEKTVADFSAAMGAAKFDRVVATVPPRLLAVIATQSKVDPEKLRASMIEVMKQGLATVKLVSYAMDMAQAQHKALANGTPYALVPTKTVLDLPDGSRLVNASHTVAVLDDGKWYLLSIEQPSQIILFRQAYPDFVNVEFPASSTEVVKK
jgi:hypothetical protein